MKTAEHIQEFFHPVEKVFPRRGKLPDPALPPQSLSIFPRTESGTRLGKDEPCT